MTNMTKRTVSRVPVSDASKRRFLIRMVTVLIGGMVLDGMSSASSVRYQARWPRTSSSLRCGRA